MRKKFLLGFISKVLLFLFIVMSSGCGRTSSTQMTSVEESNLGVIEGAVVLETDQLSAASMVQSGVVELCLVLGDGSEKCDGVVADVINGEYIFENVDLSKVYIVLFKQELDGNVESKSIVHNPESAQKVIVKSDVESDLITKFILEKIEDHELSDEIDHKVLEAIIGVVKDVVAEITENVTLNLANAETQLVSLKNNSDIQDADADFIMERLELASKDENLSTDVTTPLLSNDDEENQNTSSENKKSKDGSIKVEKVFDDSGNLVKKVIIKTKQSGEEVRFEKEFQDNVKQKVTIRKTEGAVITKSYQDDKLVAVKKELTNGDVIVKSRVGDDIQRMLFDNDNILLKTEYVSPKYLEKFIDVSISENDDSSNVDQEVSEQISGHRFESVNQQYVRTNLEDNESRYVKQRILSEFQGEVNVLEEISIDRNSQERLSVNKQYLVSKEDGLYMFNNGEWVKGISYPLVGSSQVLDDIDERTYYNAQIEYISLYTDQHGVEFQDVYKFTRLIQESGESFDFYISKTGVQIMGETRVVESVFDDFVAENNVDLDALLQENEGSGDHDHEDVDTEVSQENDDSSNVDQEVSEQISGHRFKSVNQQYVRRNVEYNESQYVKHRILSEFQGEVNVLEEIIVDRYLITGEEHIDVYHNYLVSKEDGLYMFNDGEWVKGISYPLEGISQIFNNNAQIEYLSSYTDQYGVEFQDVYKFTLISFSESGEILESNIDIYITKTGVRIMDKTEIIEESVFDDFVAENNIDLNVNQNSSIGATSVNTENNTSSLNLFRFNAN